MTVKVLILEDNSVARGMLGRAVRESFSDVEAIVECADVEGARHELQAQAQAQAPTPFRLLLVDLEQPGDSGLALLGELGRYPATKIVTTLYADDEHLFPALQCGAHGYLLKEDRFEVLVETLQKIVRGQPPLSPALARRVLSHFRTEPGGTAAAASAAAAAGAVSSTLEPPSARETEVLTYLSKGFTIKEIASLMGIKGFIVNEHVRSIYRKLGGIGGGGGGRSPAT